MRTEESCCGHGKDDFRIWFHVSDIRVLNALGRLMSANYSPYQWYEGFDGKYHDDWKICLDTDDVTDYSSEILLCLQGNNDNPNLFKEADEMADFILDNWERFCKYTLKVEPEYKSDDEYAKIICSYRN